MLGIRNCTEIAFSGSVVCLPICYFLDHIGIALSLDNQTLALVLQKVTQRDTFWLSSLPPTYCVGRGVLLSVSFTTITEGSRQRRMSSLPSFFRNRTFDECNCITSYFVTLSYEKHFISDP